MGGCSSAAYIIAIGADWIIMPALATVGSIGSIISIHKHKNIRYVDEYGSADVDRVMFTAGKFKDVYTTDGSLNADDMALVQAEVDAYYSIFLDLVAQKRKISRNDAERWADGKNFNGNQALEMGLVDQIGGFFDALQKLRDMLKQRGEEVFDQFVFAE